MALLSEEGRELYKKVICEELWLKYYNRTLKRYKVISEREFLKMNEAILARTSRLLEGIR